MARRKKEEPEVHRERIAEAAGRLFLEKGIRSTSMDEVANAAGYSKATVYVYFKSKEELAAFLAWKSMERLKEMLVEAVGGDAPYKERFISAGFALYDYARLYPEYNRILLGTIGLGDGASEDEYICRAFRTGEEINVFLLGCFSEAAEKGALKKREFKIADVLRLRGMISGLIQIAESKREYLRLVSGQEPEDFLREGLAEIYSMLEAKE